VRLAVVAENERNQELTLAGLLDPKNQKTNSTKAADLQKAMNSDKPANSTKASNSTKGADKPANKPANGTKTAADPKADATKPPAGDAKKPAGDAKKPAGDAKGAAGNTTKKAKAAEEGGAGFAPGSAPATASEADAVAAEADGEKADVMYRFAKKKVDDLIAGIQSLDSHIKEEFLALEKILHDVEIDATFDPESAADIEWITGEISKILEDTPEILALEKKLGMVKDADPVLTKVMGDLKRVTDVTRILDEQEKLNAPKPHYNSPMPAATDKKAGNKSASANATTDAAAEGDAAAPAEGATPAAAPASDLPPELQPPAAEAIQAKNKQAANATANSTAKSTANSTANATKGAN
jgi:hypothetical protein